MNRFDRQTILPGFGPEGQEKLRRARALVVGAGGLGCPALLYLAAAGVGEIGIADADAVAESNLNRQVLFGQDDIGKPKAETAAQYLREKYPDVRLTALPFFLTAENALETIAPYDIVLDGSDNFPTRYLVNDACVLLGKPLVFGAIYQYEGQVALFNAGEDPVNYRDLYPVPPAAHEIPNCEEAGVLGVLPGIIGAMQAAEAIKWLAALGPGLTNKVLFYNLKTHSTFEIALAPNPDARLTLPQTEAAFRASDYAFACASVDILSWKDALEKLAQNDQAMLADIREPGEEPAWTTENCLRLPMNELLRDPSPLKPAEDILLFCRSGVRSLILAQKLQARWPEKRMYSIEGGLLHPQSPVNNRS